VAIARAKGVFAGREGDLLVHGRSADPEGEGATGAIQSVHRALHLLSFFAPHRMPHVPRRWQWSVSDLARASGLHKSVVARLMATMAIDGWVVQDSQTRMYQIGPQAFAVGSVYEPLTALDRVARPVMEALTARCDHASYLGVPAGRHYVFLIAVESTRSLRVTIEVGESRTYNSGAIGKILLAGVDDARIRELVGPDPLPKLTPRTIDALDALMAQINEIRRTGVAVNQEESILGVESIAVGVHDRRRDCVAGLAVVYPTHVVTEAETRALIAAVADAGAEISKRLGSLSE
jgi:DNA-binding IclR family transcriptional regulator